jgi:UDPglucose 6-dehydrogenase
MADLGHDVVGYDVDEEKVAALSRAAAPFYEPGLDDLLAAGLASGRLRFTSHLVDLADAEVHFVCVGTPQRRGEQAADLRYVDAAFDQLIPLLAAGSVAAGKSTVPVGTAERIADRMATDAPEATLVWNPEFLREGHAIEDTLRPNRLVYGVPDGPDGERARQVMDRVYSPVLDTGMPVVVTDYTTAQLVKVAANSFLATKISFINAMAELCEAAGGDVAQLAEAIGHDPRIGPAFLKSGLGFGGGCLPKDIRAFMARAGELGVDQALTFLREVDSINMRRRVRMVDLAREVCGGSIVGVRIGVLGAAFKPNSDDVRDSPALSVAAQMSLQGADVVVTDPRAIDNAQAKWPDLKFVDTVEEALGDAELVLVLTEWDQYVALDPVDVRDLVRLPRILDGRGCLDPARWRAAGWTYKALGRR